MTVTAYEVVSVYIKFIFSAKNIFIDVVMK